MNAAKGAGNNQLLFIVMNIMTDLFFHGIIGDQAEKSAQAARTLAKRNGGNDLWTCVADSMYGDIKETCGKHAEAHAVRQEALTMLNGLPEGLKQRLTLQTSST